MRGGRLLTIVIVTAEITALVAAVVFVAVLVRGDGTAEGRPTAPRGEWVQIVGGGDRPLRSAQGQPLAALDVRSGGEIATMAVARDGTLWLVDTYGDLYRVEEDGVVRPQGSFFRFDEVVAAQIGPDGNLYVAGHSGPQANTVARLNLKSLRLSEALVVGLGESVIRGMAVGPDRAVYVADSFGRIHRLDVAFDMPEVFVEAVPVAGTPPTEPDCPARRSGFEEDDELIGLTVTGRVLVADPLCETVYDPSGAIGEVPTARGCESDTTRPGRVLVRGREVLMVGHSCRMVWVAEEEADTATDTDEQDGTEDEDEEEVDDSGTVLVEGDAAPSSQVIAAATDADNTLYVLDADGVWSVRLPQQD
jgi:hypothetical protein